MFFEHTFHEHGPGQTPWLVRIPCGLLLVCAFFAFIVAPFPWGVFFTFGGLIAVHHLLPLALGGEDDFVHLTVRTMPVVGCHMSLRIGHMLGGRCYQPLYRDRPVCQPMTRGDIVIMLGGAEVAINLLRMRGIVHEGDDAARSP